MIIWNACSNPSYINIIGTVSDIKIDLTNYYTAIIYRLKKYKLAKVKLTS